MFCFSGHRFHPPGIHGEAEDITDRMLFKLQLTIDRLVRQTKTASARNQGELSSQQLSRRGAFEPDRRQYAAHHVGIDPLERSKGPLRPRDLERHRAIGQSQMRQLRDMQGMEATRGANHYLRYLLDGIGLRRKIETQHVNSPRQFTEIKT